MTPRIGTRLLRHEWVVASLLALTLALLFQLGVPFRGAFGARVTGDEPFYLLTTVSLLRSGDLDLSDEYAREAYREFLEESVPLWSQSVPTPDSRVLSPHNVGLSLLVLPAYAWGGVDAAKAFLGVMGAWSVACAYVLARRTTGRPRASLVAALLVGISAPMFVYATQVYPEIPAALCVVILVLMSLPSTGGVRRGLATALLLAGLMWLGVKYAPLAACLGFAAFARLSTAGRIALVATAVPIGVHYLVFHWLTYGDLTPYAVNLAYAGSGTPELLARHVELVERLYRLLGLWVDREFGLVRWAPILALALPGRVAGKPAPQRRRSPAPGAGGRPAAGGDVPVDHHARLVVPGPHAGRGAPLAGPDGRDRTRRVGPPALVRGLAVRARLRHPQRHRRPVAVRRTRRSHRRREPLRRRRPLARQHPPSLPPLHRLHPRNPGTQRPLDRTRHRPRLGHPPLAPRLT